MDCISASVITWFLGATFDFNAEVGGPLESGASRISTACMGFGLHPLHAPCPGMNCLVCTRNVLNAPILATVVNMWRLAASIPTEKETGPTVVMHRHRRAGRNLGLQARVRMRFSKLPCDFWAQLARRRSRREIGFVLPIGAKMLWRREQSNCDQYPRTTLAFGIE